MGSIRGSSYYTIVDGPTWTKAETRAVRLGGHLATIDNRAEGEFLISEYGSERYAAFIGLNDIDNEGNLRWIDGTSIQSTDLTLLYEGFWRNGRPPNGPQRPDYEDYGLIVLQSNLANSGYNSWGIDIPAKGYMNIASNSGAGNFRRTPAGIAEIKLSYFTISDLTVTEGESGTVTISRTGGTKSSQSLTLKSSDDSAKADFDYDTVNTTVQFAANETSKKIIIRPKYDGIKEDPESFKLQLIPSTTDIVPAQLGSKSTGTVWILDNSSDNQTVNINGGKSNTGINNGNIFNGDIFNGEIGNTGFNTGTIINGDLNVTVDNSVNKNATINLINLFEEKIISRPIFFGGKHVEKMFVDISKFASQKADKIGGTELADFLQMGDGDDEFTGGLGGDSIYGNKGRDILYGNQGDDEIKGNMGDDIIYGGKDADSIYGNLDNDKLYGNIGNDYLYGGQGDDVIYAGQGDDYVYGNKGNDTLYGNKGADTFVCTKGFDVIKDFWGLDGDKISVASVAGAVISERDGSTLITSGEGQLLLEGFARQFFDESQYLV